MSCLPNCICHVYLTIPRTGGGGQEAVLETGQSTEVGHERGTGHAVGHERGTGHAVGQKTGSTIATETQTETAIETGAVPTRTAGTTIAVRRPRTDPRTETRTETRTAPRTSTTTFPWSPLLVMYVNWCPSDDHHF